MNKFLIWANFYRKPIGYTVGSINLLAAASVYLTHGDMTMNAWFALIIGGAILLDTTRN